MIDQLSLVKITYVCSKIFSREKIYFQPYENFYLPALGRHPDAIVGWQHGGSGTLNEVGVAGHFWSSSSYTGYVGGGLTYSSAQGMTFNSSKVSFENFFEVWYGAVAMPFE